MEKGETTISISHVPNEDILGIPLNIFESSHLVWVLVPLVIYMALRITARRMSRDSMEMTKDRAESNVMKILQGDSAHLREENDKLRSGIDRVSEERNVAVSQLGKVIAETEANRNRVSELQDSITRMAIKLDEQTTLLQTVLMENASLKSQVGHLEQLNERLGREVNNLEILINKLSQNYAAQSGNH